MEKDEAARLDHPQHLIECSALLLDGRQMVQDVDDIQEIEGVSRSGNVEHRAELHRVLLTHPLSCEGDLIPRSVDSGYIEAKRAHPCYIRALPAPDVKTPWPGPCRLYDPAHQARLPLQDRQTPRLGYLDVVSLGDLVEVRPSAGARRPQVDQHEHAAQEDRHTNRRETDADDRQHRVLVGESLGSQAGEHLATRHQHTSGRESQNARR